MPDAREMTLHEWVETLPSSHRAHRELAALKQASLPVPPTWQRLVERAEHDHRNLFGDQHVIFHTEQLPVTCPTCAAIRDAKQALAKPSPQPAVGCDPLYAAGFYAGIDAVRGKV